MEQCDVLVLRTEMRPKELFKWVVTEIGNHINFSYRIIDLNCDKSSVKYSSKDMIII